MNTLEERVTQILKVLPKQLPIFPKAIIAHMKNDVKERNL